MDQLAADRAFLADASDATPLTGQKTATATEREIAEDGHDLVLVIRNVVKRSESARESTRTAVGVGDGLDAGDTRKVLAALDAIGANADGLRACGVQNDDIAEAAAIATSLRAADASQGASMDSRTGRRRTASTRNFACRPR
jgi:hypothetical protein